MKLIQVIYELYEVDVEFLCGRKNEELHAIDREVRLCFEDRQSIWLSWSSEPEQFCVSDRDKPNFTGSIYKIVDMSGCLIWSRCINQEIELNFRRYDRKLLEISTKDASVWCWTEGTYGSDVLHISSQSP